MSSTLDKTTEALAAAIRLRQVRHNVTASNIANAETPGFKAKKVDFEEALATALDVDGLDSLATSHGEHFATGASANPQAEIYDNPDVAMNNDGNTVDMEKEMAALAENSILYKTALQLINKKMAAVKYAISEGR